ncbi:MAG TPA: hypothetical protein VII47_16080 [Actinomycetota bacterium]
MKKLLVSIGMAVVLGTFTVGAALAAPPSEPPNPDALHAASTAPQVTFTLLTPLPSQLAVGEKAVIGVHVESSESFVMAIALSDAYYPGRGVLFDGSPAQPNSTSADLYLSLTGRDSTADLAAVQDWPDDEDWPAGVAPLAVRVGARFAGGLVVSTTYPFAVTVP